MPKELIVSATSLEIKVAILEDDQVTEIFIERDRHRSILGNVYKGRVMRVLPGMQAAFVDIGLERNAFLYVSDFFEDYEEYDDLFSGRSGPPDDFIEDPVGQEGKPQKRQKRSRRSLRKPPDRSSRAAGTENDSGQNLQTKKDQTEKVQISISPPQASKLPYDAWDKGNVRILPDFLPGIPKTAVQIDSESELDLDQGVSILPDRLPSPARRPPDQSTADRKEKAEIDSSGSNIHHFAVARNNRARDKRRSEKNLEPMIGDLLREGQEILVQVAKEPIGKKGARITSHIVLPGRYLVFMPTVDHVGMSRRIENPKERQRLREAVLGLRGEFEKRFIVRTAGEGKSKEDFRQDMIYLTRLWETLRTKAEKASAPALIHSELDLVQRVVRDFFSDDYRSIRVDDEDQYERLAEFISNFNPKLVRKLRLYNKTTPIFNEFGIDTEIEKALKSKVWLRNGGYIVINQTEALVAIDVNTGKFVGRTNSLEDTIAKTNLDAVREVVRQIRLRDLGGIIVVDFIDMTDPKNQNRVLDALQNELSKDKSPSKVLPFNEFGLVAITRKRVKQSLERTICQPCTCCDGTGMTKSARTVCFSIHEEIRKILPALGEGRELMVRCHPDVARAIEGPEKLVATEIEEMTGKELTIRPDPLMHIEQFDLVEQ
jgi:Rne/Rng family ribonuclease